MKIYNTIFSILNQLRYLIFEIILLQLKRIRKKDPKYNQDYKIDIILPTYNRAEMLKTRSVPSVLNQTYKNFRLIIIGDCCNDDTENIINSFDDDRIIFFNIKNRSKRYPETVENHWFAGPVVAINTGLKMTNGDWIARIDDDDIWEKTHLEDLMNFAISEKAEFVSSSYKTIVNETETLKDFSQEIPPIGGVQTWLYRSYLNFFKANINCWRKSVNKVNDLDLQDRMFKAGVRMTYLKKSTCIIKPRPNEQEIGLKDYKKNKEKFLDIYKFND